MLFLGILPRKVNKYAFVGYNSQYRRCESECQKGSGYMKVRVFNIMQYEYHLIDAYDEKMHLHFVVFR